MPHPIERLRYVARADGAGPWHLDLRTVLAERAHRAGIGQLTASTWCSAHDRPLFYSHRASAGTDGRMVAFIGVPDPNGLQDRRD